MGIPIPVRQHLYIEMGLVVIIVSIVEKIDYLMMVAHSNQSGTKPNLVAKILASKAGTNKYFLSISPNEFSEVPHTNGCKTALGTVCWKQLQSDGAISNWRVINHSNCI